MKTLNLMKRFFAGCGVVVSGLCLSQQVQAASDTCKPNGAATYSFPFSPELSDPSLNVTGTVIADASQGAWNSSKNYSVTCDCTPVRNSDNQLIMGASYITATPALSTPDVSVGPLNFYVLDDYLSVASQVRIAGGYGNPGRLFPTPFTNQSNGYSTNPADVGQLCTHDYTSGSGGQISLRFRRPFVGVHTIGNTKLLDIYITSRNVPHGNVAVASVYMSGTVTVPQSCEISPAPISINLGDIMSSKFKTAGAMPDGFTPVNQQLTLACRNISDGVKVSLTFTADPDPKISNALKTTNGDIAVMIKDGNGNIISPNNGTLPINMSGLGTLNSTGQAGINVYPVNTTGNTPAVGVFNATGTVKVEIQ
ncbi:MAG: fimbrial protein [Chania sp.]